VKLSLRTRIAAAFAAAVILIVLVGAAAYRNAVAAIDEIASVREARYKLDATREFLQRIADIQASTRGFVITGNDAFLAPRDSALPYLPIVLRRLRELDVGDPWTLNVLDTLERLVRIRLAFDSQTIGLRRSRGAVAAAALVATGRGQAIMQEIRGEVAGLEERTAADRVRRSARLDTTARQTRTLALLGGLLGLVAITAGAWSIFHELAGRERAEARVRELASELQDLYENAPVGYHSLDADGMFVRINRTELEWLGRTAEEVLGKLRFSDLLAPERRQAFESAFARFKTEGTARDIEYDLVRKDGSILPILLNASVVRDPAGAYVMSRGVSIDLTERRRIEAQVKTLRGLLPICANCKKIRDDRGYWNQIESYVREHSEAEFSHGICPECAAKLYPEFVEPS